MKSSVVRSAVLVLVTRRGRGRLRGWQQRSDAGSHRHGGRPKHDDAAAQQQLHPPGRHAELGRRVRAAVHAVRRGPPRVEVRAEDHPRRRDNPGAGEAARGGAGGPGTGLRQRRLLRRTAVHRPGRPAADRRVLHAGGEGRPLPLRARRGHRGRRQDVRCLVVHGPEVTVPQDRPGARGPEDLGGAAGGSPGGQRAELGGRRVPLQRRALGGHHVRQPGALLEPGRRARRRAGQADLRGGAEPPVHAQRVRVPQGERR